MIGVEEFFGSPAFTAPVISPDGARIAYLAPRKNRMNIWVLDVAGGEPRCVTADETRNVQNVFWSLDSRWLLYAQDEGGNEQWHIFRADPDDPAAPAVDLTPFPGVVALEPELPMHRPGTIQVQMNKRDPAAFDLYDVDIETGELTEVAQNPGGVGFFLRSPDGALYARGLNDDGDLELNRITPEGPVRIARFAGGDYPMGVQPFQLTPDGTGVWMGSNRGTDRMRLVRLDLATGVQTAVDSHPTFDLDPRSTVDPAAPYPLILARATGELLGVRYLDERLEIRALDPGFAEILERLTALSDGDIETLSSDDSGQRWVVTFEHDRDPGVAWFYDHATGASRLLGRAHPHLDPAALAPMRPVSITSRDGLRLPSHLTLPVGVEPAGLPLVVLLHGGPWFRDHWGYSGAVQFLANRGYAVLQVNFRGSTGYGKAFTSAAIGEFAGAMHDDVIDAVEWAVAEGYADRERIGIFGGSYGGYATLVGVTVTPDVFAAAIDYVGISSLPNFLRSLPSFTRPHVANNWHLFVGDPDDPEQEAEMLARSPITYVDRIRTPLLVLQGANDPRVVRAESDNLVAALRDRGVDVEYIVKDDEGHGFVNPENQIDLFRAVERFLARHLGGNAPAGG
ncbi:alpha/beta fold hydrolase [Nocardia sp. NPDC057353]|uniref:S9 family peptidase n=1 Tax=Nocardia sp. NPDC057353 TaxID=3346104 RepID=UPI003627D9C0